MLLRWLFAIGIFAVPGMIMGAYIVVMDSYVHQLTRRGFAVCTGTACVLAAAYIALWGWILPGHLVG